MREHMQGGCGPCHSVVWIVGLWPCILHYKQKTLSVSHKQGPNGLSQSFFKIHISHKKRSHWSHNILTKGSHNWKGQLSITKHLQNGLSQTNGAFGLPQCATCVVSHKHITAHKTGPSASHKGNDQLVSHKQQLDWSLTNFQPLVPITTRMRHTHRVVHG